MNLVFPEKNKNTLMAKNNYNLVVTILILWLALGGAFFVLAPLTVGADSLVQTTIKITVCGDGVIDSGEQCDGANLNGASCSSRGFSGGSLSCLPSCDFNTTGCTSGGGGGGGGGGYTPPSVPETKVNFLGRAYPRSQVTLLKDAQVAAEVTAGPDAKFEISLSGLAGGNYLFSLYGEDAQGRRSPLLTFPVSVTAGAITTASGIFIAPTLALDKTRVKPGDNLAIFGQSNPESSITIAVNSEQEFFGRTLADASGVYLYNFDTAVLKMGEHFVKAKASREGEISGYSKAISFLLSDQIPEPEPEVTQIKGDFNKDRRVNLVDFSVAAYWYRRPSPPSSVDLNRDNKVDLVDFSILAYHWTG